MAVLATESSDKEHKLAPGMVIGPDGKPCKACAGAVAFASGFKKNMKLKAMTAGAASSSTIPPNSSTTSNPSTPANYPLPTPLEEESTSCPATTELLGRHTWTFLHSAASYYPTIPNLLQKTSMTYLLNSLPVLYPCSTCAGELGEYMKENPVTEKVVGGRKELEDWLCRVHNEVNGRLGKEMFDCSKVGERWREGPADGRCD